MVYKVWNEQQQDFVREIKFCNNHVKPKLLWEKEQQFVDNNLRRDEKKEILLFWQQLKLFLRSIAAMLRMEREKTGQLSLRY